MADIRAQPLRPQHPRLGRLASKDERDLRYRMRSIARTTTRTSRSWSCAEPIYDQGNLPQCVAYGAKRVLVTRPIVTNTPYTFQQLYDLFQRADEWPGEDYDGTSVRAAMKVFQELGLIQSYVWAMSLAEMFPYLMEVGPCLIGVDWTKEMFYPDSRGFVHPTGVLEGGHALEVKGYKADKRCPDGTLGAYRWENSWGDDWGQDGRCWISVPDFEKLVKGLTGWPAELAAPTEFKVKPA